MQLSVKFDPAGVIRQMGIEMTPRLKRAGIRAVNRTADGERTALSREVAADMRLRVTRVKREIKVQKASDSRPNAYVVSTGEQIPAIEFQGKGRYPSRGKGGGARANLPGSPYAKAFIAIMRSGHRGIFARSGKARLPLYELKGPSIAVVFGKLVPLGDARRAMRLMKELTHEIAFALKRTA